MAVIDVGSSCDITGSVATAGKTRIDKQNPANLTGTIDYCCLNSDTALTDIKIASFIDEGGNVLSTHDYTGLADQGSNGLSEYNAPGDFTAFDIDAGEYLGIYYSSGGIRFNNSGVGQWNSSGDHIPSSSVTYSLTSNVQLSLYATGNTTGEETATEDFKTDLKAEGWGKADIVLDLSAYFQKLENLKLDIKLHGDSVSDLPLDTHAAAWAHKYLLSSYQEYGSLPKGSYPSHGIPLFGLPGKPYDLMDVYLDVSAGLQALESMSFGVQAAKEISNINAQIDINTTDGINTQDNSFDLEITDGTILYDAGLDLAVIEVMPSFKAVYAMHLKSVITEI